MQEFPAEVQEVINSLLEADEANSPLPPAEELNKLFAFVASPLYQGDIYPERRDEEGHGAYWRSTLNVPLRTLLQYVYDQAVPGQLAFPASIRYQIWQSGSDILNLETPLWEQLGQYKDTPLALRGREFESVTPDTFSGSYYSYYVDRLLILTEYEGRQILLSVSWQKEPSEVGKKATPLGDYENWDFIYSNAPGTLKSGIGWADTYIYSACSILVLSETAPGSGSTGYAIFKWLNAGWAGMNMVKREHIMDGSDRSFRGLKEFFESPLRPAAEELKTYAAGLEALSLEDLRARFRPYALKVSAAAAEDEILRSADFQAMIADGSYGDNLSRDELIAALAVNFLKQKLGKPLLTDQLAGPLANTPD